LENPKPLHLGEVSARLRAPPASFKCREIPRPFPEIGKTCQYFAIILTQTGLVRRARSRLPTFSLEAHAQSGFGEASGDCHAITCQKRQRVDFDCSLEIGAPFSPLNKINRLVFGLRILSHRAKRKSHHQRRMPSGILVFSPHTPVPGLFASPEVALSAIIPYHHVAFRVTLRPQFAEVERRMPDIPDDTTLSQSAVQRSFIAIGPYRLTQMLGAGGMTEVWRAEQTEPFHRTVALKLIKAGMDTRAVVARFDSERQALALMEHPNIAKVFEAGATPEGRPYFVMEYVHGFPITDYGDRHRFTIKERLGLFMQVCEGVQHAHQKAIIHRDLKPSNVLVDEVDNKPVPKIFDFGLAKAMGRQLTEMTLFTEAGSDAGHAGLYESGAGRPQ
jgi:hypothetical protein